MKGERTMFKKRGIWLTRLVASPGSVCTSCRGKLAANKPYFDLQIGGSGTGLCLKCWAMVQVATAIALGQEP